MWSGKKGHGFRSLLGKEVFLPAPIFDVYQQPYLRIRGAGERSQVISHAILGESVGVFLDLQAFSTL